MGFMRIDDKRYNDFLHSTDVNRSSSQQTANSIYKVISINLAKYKTKTNKTNKLVNKVLDAHLYMPLGSELKPVAKLWLWHVKICCCSSMCGIFNKTQCVLIILGFHFKYGCWYQAMEFIFGHTVSGTSCPAVGRHNTHWSNNHRKMEYFETFCQLNDKWKQVCIRRNDEKW